MKSVSWFTKLFAGVIVVLGIAWSNPYHPTVADEGVEVRIDTDGQVFFYERGKPVLRYNYQMVYEDDEFAFNGLDANEYVASENDTFMANPSIYAVPRSNYIHPLYGLNGEILTRDWSKDHPHHRGVYWAWPEVDYGTKSRTDLHALQKVFARPTGRLKRNSKKAFAQIEAENFWILEEDILPIVRELAMIRVYTQIDGVRIIDLAFHFEGVRDSVTIARRGTDLYGGLNIRMMTPKKQDISYFTDKPGAEPRRAWSDLSGLFSGGDGPSGLMVFQHVDNPEYPGAWVEYPDLSWVQPTFPTAGTRYPLEPGKPLVLRFRLVIHSGARPTKKKAAQWWDEYQSSGMPEFTFNPK